MTGENRAVVKQEMWNEGVVDRSEEDVECSCEQFDGESVLAAGVCTGVQM